MGKLTKALGSMRLKAAQAIAGRMEFPGRILVYFGMDRPELDDMANEVGDGTSADVLMSPVRWIQRSMREAPLLPMTGDEDPIEGGDFRDIIASPNPFYSCETLLDGTVLSLCLDGNAYWIVAHNRNGRPVELYYAPHAIMEPKWPDYDAGKFITYYAYNAASGEKRLKPYGSESFDPGCVEGLSVIHFRDGVDPDNLRKGLSPIKGLLREIWSDTEAAMFTAALLRNGGIPGVTVSPSDPNVALTPEEAKALKQKVREEYSGPRRGGVMVSTIPLKVEQFGFSPQQLDLSPLRDVSEERVTAALGVQAAVVGFGSGLQQTKVGATMRELKQMSWMDGVIPVQKLIAGQLSRTIAPDLGADHVAFDNSDVEALRENQDKKAARLERLVRGGIITRKMALDELGFESTDADDVYLMGLATIEVPRGQRAVPPARAGDNGDGDKWALGGAASSEWGKSYLKQHEHDAAERAIVERAPRARAPRVAIRLAARLDRAKRRAASIFEPLIERVFTDLGREAYRAARQVLGDVELASDAGGEIKQGLTPEEAAIAESVIDAMDTAAAQASLQDAYEQGFLAVAQDVSGEVASVFGVAFQLDDAAQQAVLQEGGLRVGLVDLDAQTREAVFEALAEGRAEGLTADNLARHIRDRVEAGPWRDAATRAKVIARTEGAHAANVSTLEAARTMPDTSHVQVFDNRTGYDDPECSAVDGIVVTIDEAEAMGLAHPNCTRSFVPINDLLMEEMGL